MTNEAFAYMAEDTEGFNLVDTQKAVPQAGWDKGMRGRGRGRFGRGGRGGGRWGAPQPMGAEAKFNAKFNAKKAPQARAARGSPPTARSPHRPPLLLIITVT